MDIETLVEWSEPKEVNTRFGTKSLRTAEPTKEFWQAWKANKAALKAAGISCSKKDNGDFEVCHWGAVGDQEVRDESLKKSSALTAGASFKAIVPEGLELYPFQAAGVEYALRVFGVIK